MIPAEWVEKSIRINSITDRSNEEYVQFLMPLLQETGLRITEQKVVEGKVPFKNLLAYSHAPDSPDLIAFNSHLDTVSYGVKSLWTKTDGDPFSATRVRNRIYGLGTADVKLDFLCKILAARKAKPWNRPICLVGTYGEERGLIGITKLFEQKKFKPKYALVGEPSNLELIYAHKGHFIFTVVLDLDPSKAKRTTKSWVGKSAHSSTPELGVNAIRKALNDIRKRGLGIAALVGGVNDNKIPELCEAELMLEQTKSTKRLFEFLESMDELGRELKKQKNPRFQPSFSTLSLNLAKMQGDTLCLTFDVRSLPDLSLPAVVGKVEKLVQKFNFKLTDTTLNLPLKGRRESPFLKELENSLKLCGVKPIKKTKASSTEAAVYNEFGAEAVVFGPGLSVGNVHRPNEYQLTDHLNTAIRFYTEIMKREWTP